MNSIRTNLIYILIIALLMMILYETCKSKAGSTTSSTSDTTTQIHYVYYRDTSKTKPIFLKGSRDTIFENTVEYMPSENYNDLVEQFTELKQILLSRNIYLDSIHLDSLGWVKVTDTIQKNAIIGRNIVKDIKIPIKEITITKTIEAERRRALYFGGSMFGAPGVNTRSTITNVNGGLMYKDKHDRLFGAHVQWNGKEVNYGLSGYLKLSFRKK